MSMKEEGFKEGISTALFYIVIVLVIFFIGFAAGSVRSDARAEERMQDEAIAHGYAELVQTDPNKKPIWRGAGAGSCLDAGRWEGGMNKSLTSRCRECSGTGRIEIASRIDQVAREMSATKRPERHRPSCPHNCWPKQKCNCGVASRNRLIDAHLAELIECAQLIRESVDD